MMWVEKENFLGYNLMEKYFWQHDSLICKLVTKGSKLITFIIVCGSVSFFHTVVSRGGGFEDIAANLPFLANQLFGIVIVHVVETAAVPGKNVWTYIESNPQFSYSRQKYDRVIRMNNYLVKGFIVYLCIMMAGSFIFCEFAYCDDPADYACGLVYPNFLFVNLSQRPYREIFNLAALYSLGVILVSVLLGLSYIHAYLIFAADCFDEFKSQLTHIADTKDLVLRKHQLIKLYELQQYVWKGSELMCDLFAWTLLLQYLTSGIIIGLILISALIEINIVQVGLLLYYIIGCCVCGFTGEEFAQISIEFQDATFYGIPWDGDMETARFLMFMNINLRKQMALPLGNYAVYTNELVLLVFKAVYSIVMMYINMM